ncbi:MAG TPA: hypothetical protein PKD68_00380 [Candidatus Saccharibacteria bacterium]|nr:hypothetical protein [Candidatus Saccharibacteria bacterium]
MNDEVTWDDIQNLTFDPWQDHAADLIDRLLKYIGAIELLQESYSFDQIRFWVRKETGQILYAEDSGCSCPIPFGDTRVKDLLELPSAYPETILERKPNVYIPRVPMSERRRDLRRIIDRAMDYVQQNLEEGRL